MNDTTTVTRDAIAGFAGSWGSGLAFLLLQSGAQVPADNGPLARWLGSIGADLSGHTVNDTPQVEIVYWLDEWGLCLGGAALYEEWLNAGLQELEPGVPTQVPVAL